MLQYLGTIAVLTTETKNNKDTSTPFDIPLGTKRIALQPSGNSARVAVGYGNDAFAATANSRVIVAANEFVTVEILRNALEAIVSIHNATGSTINTKVYRLE